MRIIQMRFLAAGLRWANGVGRCHCRRSSILKKGITSMKMTLLLAICSCFLAAVGYGQNVVGQDKQTTAAPAANLNLIKGNLNGRAWIAFSDSERQAFVQ